LQFAAAELRANERCVGAPVDVVAASSEERELICSAATEALQLLSRCGIFSRRTLTIQIAGEVRHPFGRAVLGLFDPRSEKIWITRFGAISALVSGTPFGELRPREFYKGLAVHEIVHAVMQQNAKRQATSRSEHEYPAYALQIASLPSRARESFLQSVYNGQRAREFVFNDFILAMDPFFFAASAYEHFRRSADGCAHLTALLEGEVAFISVMPDLP
jgi:hypothetical protein